MQQPRQPLRGFLKKALRAGQDQGQAGSVGMDRVEVEVRLADLLEQGGRMYPVESVTVERGWYFTLPAGSIDVREAQRP